MKFAGHAELYPYAALETTAPSAVVAGWTPQVTALGSQFSVMRRTATPDPVVAQLDDQ